MSYDALDSPATPVRSERLLSDLDALALFGGRPDGGVDRGTFSPAYREALAWLTDRMREARMTVRLDAAGNLIGRYGPMDGPAVICGSHVDSIPGGGRYDGTLGVLAGIEVARCLAEANERIDRALEVVAFADEEGSHLSLLGSRAMVGDLSVDELTDSFGRDGTRLADVMRAQGLDPERIREAARDRTEVAAYVELHIEQGPVLEARGVDIGIVESVVGIHRCEMRFEGQAIHAGTTPVAHRSDALRGAADFITAAYRRFEEEFGDEHILSYGAIEVRPGVANVVPYEAVVVQEIRSVDAHAIDAIFDMTIEEANGVCVRQDVGFAPVFQSRDPAAHMSADVIRRIAHSCKAMRCSSMPMASGAGHDAQVMARFCDTGMIFVPSVSGISHSPSEHTTPSQIARGANVLYETLRSLLRVRD